MESEKNWYVIHTYSGYEKKVKDNLERKVRSMGLENVIERILVPEEDEIDVKDGRKRTVRRKIYPGNYFVSLCNVSFLQNGQYFFNSKRSGLFFLFLFVR